jgi:hypothetical protein
MCTKNKKMKDSSTKNLQIYIPSFVIPSGAARWSRGICPEIEMHQHEF